MLHIFLKPWIPHSFVLFANRHLPPHIEYMSHVRHGSSMVTLYGRSFGFEFHMSPMLFHSNSGAIGHAIILPDVVIVNAFMPAPHLNSVSSLFNSVFMIPMNGTIPKTFPSFSIFWIQYLISLVIPSLYFFAHSSKFLYLWYGGESHCTSSCQCTWLNFGFFSSMRCFTSLYMFVFSETAILAIRSPLYPLSCMVFTFLIIESYVFLPR